MTSRKQDQVRRRFGHVRGLPSGRYQARYADPDGRRTPTGQPIMHNAPTTFDTQQDADAWLIKEQRLITNGEWTPPGVRKHTLTSTATFAEYAEQWLTTRRIKKTGAPLAPKTIEGHRTFLAKHILPTFGQFPLHYITQDQVDAWYAKLLTNRPAERAKVYNLLHAIMETAVSSRGPLRGKVNPVDIPGASHPARRSKTRPATRDVLNKIVEAMPERYRALILLATWCGLREGELFALRRSDLDLDVAPGEPGSVEVTRSVTRTVETGAIAKETKTGEARTVFIPPEVVPMIEKHLINFVSPERDALVFPADRDPNKFLAPSTLYLHYHRARKKAGRPDLRIHDLRHTGATWVASSGATVAEIKAFGGWLTWEAASKYQHAEQERMRQLASRMGRIDNVIPIKTRQDQTQASTVG